MPTEYEVINIDTKEVSPVVAMSFGGLGENGKADVVATIKKADGSQEELVFSNAGQQGNIIDEDASNDFYAIRQVGTQMTPNQDGVVTDQGDEVAISDRTASDIMNGDVDPDSVKSE